MDSQQATCYTVPVLTYRVVDEANIHELWPIARAYFLKVVARNGATTLPEDAYAQMKLKACSILVLAWDGQVVGATAVRLAQRDDGRRELFIWALGTEPALPDEFFHAFNSEMLRHAAGMQAVSVSMTSVRPGWGRFLRKYGWAPTHTTYEIEVPQ